MTLNVSRNSFASILLFFLAFLLLTPATGHAVNVCDSFYSPGFRLAQGKLNPAMRSRAKPAKGAVVNEPNFHTCLVRATNHRSEPPNTFARNDYSRRQAFNYGSTYFIVYSNGTWHLYNANTLAHVRALTTMGGDAEPQWHPTNPNLLYYLPSNGGTKLMKVDVRNNTASTVVNFVGRLPSWASSAAHIWTRSEGSPSADGRYWGFLIYDNGWNMLGYIVWDLQQNRLAGSRASTADQDNASMSASGRWFVASGGNGTWAWSRDFTRKKKIDSYGVHSDLAKAANGNDYYVSVDFESGNGDVYYVNLDTCPSVPASASSAPVCPSTVLFSMYPTGGWSSMHFSGKAFGKPGWVLISTYDAESNGSGLPWFTNKVMAVELKPSPRIYPLAYTRRVRVTSGDSNGAGNYWAEPHASVNRDFTRIAFNSNWGNSHGADIDTYIIQLRSGIFGGTAGTATGGAPQAGPASGSDDAPPLSIAAAIAAPAAASDRADTYSVGCPACARMDDLWDQAKSGLVSAVRALGLAPEERTQRPARKFSTRAPSPGAAGDQALPAPAR